MLHGGTIVTIPPCHHGTMARTPSAQGNERSGAARFAPSTAKPPARSNLSWTSARETGTNGQKMVISMDKPEETMVFSCVDQLPINFFTHI
jgi:hypothetical protein